VLITVITIIIEPQDTGHYMWQSNTFYISLTCFTSPEDDLRREGPNSLPVDSSHRDGVVGRRSEINEFKTGMPRVME